MSLALPEYAEPFALESNQVGEGVVRRLVPYPADLDQLVAPFREAMASTRVRNTEGDDISLFANVVEGSIAEIRFGGDPVKRWSLSCELVMNREKREKDK